WAAVQVAGRPAVPDAGCLGQRPDRRRIRSLIFAVEGRSDDMTSFIKSLAILAALALVFTLPLTAANGTLVRIIHTKTMKVTKKIPLSGHPNNLAITPDGKKLYVAIAQAPGAVDVIDAAKQARAKTISVHGGVHNTYVTPDGKYAVAGMIGARNITVIDTKTDMPVWAHYFDLGVRPIAFDRKPDGSTAHAYAQLTDFNGFAVLDFDTRKEVARIKYPDVDKKTPGHGGNTSHGIAVTPDQKTLVANSSINSVVYIYSLPDLKLTGQI